MEKAKLFPTMTKSKGTIVTPECTRNYPSTAEDYELLEICGIGVSAKVWKAKCIPFDEIVAIKILDLESLNCKMEEVIHEAQMMKSYNHPNVLCLHTSFMHGQHLWFIQPYVAGGSVLNIMKFKYNKGLDELAIAVIMKEVAKALEYVHKCGGIHRDVKAGNILIGLDGSVKLADFGVAATMERGSSWGTDKVSRKTFVGTPCWMAPEVMEQINGYDSKADIWSFGITLLELAHGHAPFAKYPPMKVLLLTLHNPPPQLEDTSGHRHFSKHMRELVASCLQKDPSKRPTASNILDSKFFRNTHDTKYLASHLLDNLIPLTERMKIINENKSSKSMFEIKEEEDIIKAKEEYVKGVSGWDFDLASLKAEAENTSTAAPTVQSSKEPLSSVIENIEEKVEALNTKGKQHDIEGGGGGASISISGFGVSGGDRVISPISSNEDLYSPTKKVTNKITGHNEKNGHGHGHTKQSRFIVLDDKTETSTDSKSNDEAVKFENGKGGGGGGGGGDNTTAISITKITDIKHEEKAKSSNGNNNNNKIENMSLTSNSARLHKKGTEEGISHMSLSESSEEGSGKQVTEEGKKVQTNIYRCNRFYVVEENVIQDVKSASYGKPKTASKSNITGGELHSNAKNSHQNKVALLPVKAMQHQLEHIIKGYDEQGAHIQKLIHALHEADKGKTKHLESILAEPHLSHNNKNDSKEYLESKIKELESENKMLREKVTSLERQIVMKGMNEENAGIKNLTGSNSHSNILSVENHKN